MGSLLGLERSADMSHIVANAIDWYVDKLNKAHFLPTNLATLIRDISAKQIGGRGFTPRPMTEDNFTDAELDSAYRLAKDPKGGFRKHISYDTYKDIGGSNVIGNGRLHRYLAPLKTVQTTIGQAALSGEGDDTVLTDTYDFNRKEKKHKVFDHGDGTLSFRNANYGNRIERYPRSIVSSILIGNRLRGGTYGHIRHNAARLGHVSDDPDADKIKIRLSMKEIEKRLGDRLGKYDITGKMPDSRFAWKIGGDRSGGRGSNRCRSGRHRRRRNALGQAQAQALAALAGAGAYGMKSLKDWSELMMRRPGDLNSQGRDSPVEYVSSLDDL